MAKKQDYGNDSISALKGADRVRKRPGVIFGSDGLELIVVPGHIIIFASGVELAEHQRLPDLEVFTDINIPAEYFSGVMKRQAVVNAGITFHFRNETEPGR